jgi:predicted nucleotidyltransferase
LDLAAAVGRVRGFLDREGIPFAVIGALALHTYGYSRATNDVDLLVGREAQDRLIAFLEKHGFETLYRSDGYSNHVHIAPTLGRLDVVYVDEDTHGKIFAEARHVSLAGVSVVVPKPEHLAAMKIHAMKNDPSRVFQEMADIQFLMRLPGVDRDQIRRYFEESGHMERFHELERSL